MRADRHVRISRPEPGQTARQAASRLLQHHHVGVARKDGRGRLFAHPIEPIKVAAEDAEHRPIFAQSRTQSETFGRHLRQRETGADGAEAEQRGLEQAGPEVDPDEPCARHRKANCDRRETHEGVGAAIATDVDASDRHECGDQR